MKTFILHIILLCLTPITWGQYGIGSTFEELPLDSIPPASVEFHSALKPSDRQYTYTSWKKNDSIRPNYYFIAPAVDINGGYSKQFNYRTGLGLNFHAQTGKWFIKIGAIGGIGSVDSLFHTPAYYYEQKGKNYYYADIRGRISYTPNEIFNFQVGLDNNFIGEGSRSLFLSDYGAPYPFAQIKAKFWRMEYTLLYQFMREHSSKGWKSKFATSHNISLNVTKWLNFGVFETVLFQPKDTLLNRGYEAEYLNPLVFFRPQEYSLGSADNILMGISMNANYKGHMFYAQFVLDEFSLSEIRKNPTWWANKYGGQFGFKGRFNTSIGAFFYRAEYNFMRPYTYSHINEMQAYGNQGHVLAHPLGGNFHELVAELKWQKGKFLAKFFTVYYLKGYDKDGYSYGGDIYMPYTLRPEEYNHKIGQGQGQNISKTILTVDYEVWKPGQIHVFLENHFIIQANKMKASYIPVIGIRSQLWNDYRNY
ncbi:MAG: hypothetical protein M9916_02360 [Crocinitomicaceae bacterium]|nr:hypothetical protein [Crocinitomicaceae bacterium]